MQYNKRMVVATLLGSVLLGGVLLASACDGNNKGSDGSRPDLGSTSDGPPRPDTGLADAARDGAADAIQIGHADAGDGGWITPGVCGTADELRPLHDSPPAVQPVARQVVTVAGSDAAVPLGGHVDAEGLAARLHLPRGVTLADNGKLYLTECGNYTIREVDPANWGVTTVAGKPGEIGAADGQGSAARFGCAWSLVALEGVLYVADSTNQLIRSVEIATGTVGTVAGRAGERAFADGVGDEARFWFPAGITTDGTYLYVADMGNQVIRRIDPATRIVTTLAGAVGGRGAADGDCATARFNAPWGVATDGLSLFIGDSGNHTIRQLDLRSGAVTTLAGQAGQKGHQGGSAAQARFDSPTGLATDGASLYISDTNNRVVMQVAISDGETTTLAGQPGVTGTVDGLGDAAELAWPAGLVVLQGGKLVLADAHNQRLRLLGTQQ